MENKLEKRIIKRCKYISIMYDTFVETVAKMIQEHYDTQEYDNSIIFVNIFTDVNGYSFANTYFKEHRKIYYFLEHPQSIIDYSNYYNFFFRWVKEFGIDEIWTMDVNNQLIKDNTDIPVKFMPVRYTSLINKPNFDTEKDFDFGFVGIISYSLSNHRNDILSQIEGKGYKYKVLHGDSIEKLSKELSNCRYVLDIQRFGIKNFSTQNQVRIFEHICLGHHVLSEKCGINMFPGLINEWSNIDELSELLDNGIQRDFSEEYKTLTYKDEDYKEYKNKIINNYETIL